MFTALGAYGLRIEGLPAAEKWMQSVTPDAPTLDVRITCGVVDAGPSVADAVHGDVYLAMLVHARMHMQRGSGLVNYHVDRMPEDAELLHPYLSPAAALAHVWEGREAIHGGAVMTPAGAVLVLGGKEAGKSSTLAWMATELGVEVLSDDLAIVDRGSVLAGPRSVDLREPTVRWHADRWRGTLVRSKHRVRVTLPPAPAAVPIVGSVLLGWGDELRLSPVGFTQRLAHLAPQRFFGTLDADPVGVLELARLPMLFLRRPANLDALPAAAEALLSWWS